MNVDIFAQYIISCSLVHARKYYVSEKIEYYKTNILNTEMCENMSSKAECANIYLAKISTFTVFFHYRHVCKGLKVISAENDKI